MDATRPRVLAIVVAFHPREAELQPLIESLAVQCDAVCIVDNTPGAPNGVVALLSRLQAMDPAVVVHRFGDNLGIGAALNHGLDLMVRQRFDYALLQDQDSLPSPDMVERLVSLAGQLVSRGVRVGCVSPEYVDSNAGLVSTFQVRRPGRWFYETVTAAEANPYIEVLTTISSGALLPRDAVETCGLMRADFFIDQVDMEWCHRARDHGFRLFGTSTTRMRHQLGEEVFRAWLFGWRACNHYPHERLYYRFRNFTLLCRMRHVDLGWKVRAAAYWIYVFYAFALFGVDRRGSIRMMVRGVLDGLAGRSGRVVANGERRR